MKIVKTLAFTTCFLLPFALQAEAEKLNSVAVDLQKIPSKIKQAGTITKLAQDTNGRGLVMLRSLKSGEITSPHKPGNKAVRLAVVTSGVIYHGTGETVDHTKETPYHVGDVMLLAATDMYWMAARDGDASIMFTFVLPEQLNPNLLKKMKNP